MLRLGFKGYIRVCSTQSWEKGILTRGNNLCKGTEVCPCELMDRVNVQAGKAGTGQIMKGLYIILRGSDSIPPQESGTVSVRKATPFGVWEWTTGSREVH